MVDRPDLTKSHLGPGAYEETESYVGQQVVNPTVSDHRYRMHQTINRDHARSREGSRSPSPDVNRGHKGTPIKLDPVLISTHSITSGTVHAGSPQSGSPHAATDNLPASRHHNSKPKHLPEIDLTVDVGGGHHK